MVHEILLETYQKSPNKLALITRNRKFTYEDIYKNAMKISELLRKRNIPIGSHIGLYFNNTTEFIFSFFGILISKMVVVPIPIFSKQVEIETIAENCDIHSIIALEPPKSIKRPVISWGDIESYEPSEVGYDHDTKSDLENSLALLLTTSGSTSAPKIVMLSHKNIISSAIAHQNSVNFSPADVFMVTMPINFISTITTQILVCILSETAIVLEPLPLIPRSIFNIIEQNRINCISMVPTTLNFLLDISRSKKIVLSNIHTCVVSGAPLSNDLFQEAKNLLPNADILQTYGMTEASPRISIMDRGDDELSCGKVVKDVEVVIRDSASNPLPTNMVGDIYVKGPNVMLGYYKNPRLTATIIQNNWLMTEDIGKFDMWGNLRIVGRKKNIILVGGMNVYPEEIEDILNGIITVDLAVVVGVPDKVLGEVPAALIKPKRGMQLQERFISSILANHLSTYKIPRQLLMVKDIPLTPNGKVDRIKSKDLLKSILNCN
ncbi:class I adenylate-forming enzyme family protein [Paenibacillus lautus]|uniref:class I adenylate-forming enzyme family protein n=1 Tax=Paenibacillus lautus TaxID=1401 RepID=UPI003D2CF8D1